MLTTCVKYAKGHSQTHPLAGWEHGPVALGPMEPFSVIQLGDHSVNISVRLHHAFALRGPTPISNGDTYDIGHSVSRGYLIIRGSTSQFSRGSLFTLLVFTAIYCPISLYNL